MHPSRILVVLSTLSALSSAFAQSPATPAAGTLSKLPVREVTVFKDGNAFVLHEGSLPVDANGEIVLDNLPTPVIGTFWPYQVHGKLRGVVATRQPVTTQRPALSVYDLLKANIGADVTIIETPERRFDAKILDIPQPTPSDTTGSESDSARSPSPPGYRPPEQAEVILLQTKDGVLARPLTSISQVVFKVPPRQSAATPELRNLLRLQLDGPRRAAGEQVGVGMAYLQRGLRWIPSYRLALDGKGHSHIDMQATVANELVNLQNATVNLVIGVPSFAFKDTIDPLALQDTFARLSPLFMPGSRTANALSNAIQTQAAAPSYARMNEDMGEPPGNAATVEAGGSSEDFYVFTAKNVTLRKGERQAFPLAQYDLPYEDIYTLEAPAKPPVDVYRELNYDQQRAISQSLAAPSVMHKIRLSNSSTQPLTTAPTLIESNGRLLAQTLMTYTASGGRSDLDLAPAVDVTVKRQETEGKRTPNAIKWRDYDYARVDVDGRLVVTSFHDAPIKMELTQQFLGTVDRAEQGGQIRKLGLGDEEDTGPETNLPTWWNYNSGDWRAVNGLSTVKWAITVPAKGQIELPYAYHYFWR
jgi:hypothetical protein